MNNRRIRLSLLLTLLGCVLPLTSCHKAEQARLDQPRIASGVRMQDVMFHSAALNRNMPYRVFLPEKIPASRKLPVVYLLHGGDDGSFVDWSNRSDVSVYSARGFILVMPEGAFSYYMNAAARPANRYEDYTFHDLISDVESRFPVAKGRANRAVIGISMGGFAAIKLALTRPDLFFFVGAFSPPVDIVRRPFNIRRPEEWWRIRTIFGPPGSESRRKRDPFALAQTANPAVTPYLYLTAGDHERFFDQDRRFASLLKELNVHFEFHTKPGGHDWTEWDAQIPGCFDSLIQHLAPPTAD